jgi:hypothetical protein
VWKGADSFVLTQSVCANCRSGADGGGVFLASSDPHVHFTNFSYCGTLDSSGSGNAGGAAISFVPSGGVAGFPAAHSVHRLIYRNCYTTGNVQGL